MFRALLDQQNDIKSGESRRDLFLLQLLDEGLISEIKMPGTHSLPVPRKRVRIEGQPISQTVIEERR